MPLLVQDQLPPCDLDETHEATIHCPECEECFCSKCDLLIHARRKNKLHVREAIEVVEPEPEPVPCDSDPTHIAVMHCEDCEENFCADCDFTFHSRRKTANHARFEGARRPEDIAALAAEAAAEAAAAAEALAAKAQLDTLEEETTTTQPQRPASSAATSSYAAAAAAGGRGATGAGARTKTGPGAGAHTPSPTAPTSSISKAKPTGAPAGASAAGRPASATAAAAAGPATAASSTPATSASSPLLDADQSGEQRAAEHRAVWDDRRRALCKAKYNAGHWLALSTDQRKELAVTLCQELLFNPAASSTRTTLVAVDWVVQSYWTSYSLDVSCQVTTTTVKKNTQNKTSITMYKVHVDDHGKLAEFDVDVDGVASSQCSVM